jgi:hypothetical protein
VWAFDLVLVMVSWGFGSLWMGEREARATFIYFFLKCVVVLCCFVPASVCVCR